MTAAYVCDNCERVAVIPNNTCWLRIERTTDAFVTYSAASFPWRGHDHLTVCGWRCLEELARKTADLGPGY